MFIGRVVMKMAYFSISRYNDHLDVSRILLYDLYLAIYIIRVCHSHSYYISFSHTRSFSLTHTRTLTSYSFTPPYIFLLDVSRILLYDLYLAIYIIRVCHSHSYYISFSHTRSFSLTHTRTLTSYSFTPPYIFSYSNTNTFLILLSH